MRGTIPEIQTHALGLAPDHRHRLDAEPLELLCGLPEQHDVPPTERSVQAAKERQEKRAAASKISRRDPPVAVRADHGELGRELSRLNGWPTGADAHPAA
jgi:hypothetical protein